MYTYFKTFCPKVLKIYDQEKQSPENFYIFTLNRYVPVDKTYVHLFAPKSKRKSKKLFLSRQSIFIYVIQLVNSYLIGKRRLRRVGHDLATR